MSRHVPPVTQRAWRLASGGLATVAALTAIVALLIGSQALDTTPHLKPVDGKWITQSGRVEADRVVLDPAANAIGTALFPITSTTFTLQARIDLKDPAGSGGLIVQADDADHFTAFLISPDGYFRLSDYRNGAWIDRVAWQAWPHIHRGSAPNLLRAECGSKHCAFFVNDEWTWEEQPMPVSPWIGVIANGVEARFDQVGWHP